MRFRSWVVGWGVAVLVAACSATPSGWKRLVTDTGETVYVKLTPEQVLDGSVFGFKQFVVIRVVAVPKAPAPLPGDLASRSRIPGATQYKAVAMEVAAACGTAKYVALRTRYFDNADVKGIIARADDAHLIGSQQVAPGDRVEGIFALAMLDNAMALRTAAPGSAVDWAESAGCKAPDVGGSGQGGTLTGPSPAALVASAAQAPGASQPVPAAAASTTASTAASTAATTAALPSAPAEGDTITLSGVIAVGHDRFAVGRYTELDVDQAFTSPCDGQSVHAVLLMPPLNSDADMHMYLQQDVGRHVRLRGEIDCPVSGLQFLAEPPAQ